MAQNDIFLVSGNPSLLKRLNSPFGETAGALSELAFGRLKCRTCHAERLVDLHWRGLTSRFGHPTQLKVEIVSPGAAVLVCRQCHDQTRGLFAWTKDSVSVVFVEGGASLSSPHAHPAVCHYLDEAARCRDANALSATMAMYRAALEQLLFEQGFKMRMLGPKVTALVEAVKNSTAPKWALDLDPEVLKHVKELGDGAIHPNDGDIALQEVIDGGVIEAVEALFESFLDVVYERPAIDAARNAKLRAAATAMKAKPPTPPAGG